MAIKRYFASKDNTITNAFKDSLITRGTGSNMGAADILESFVIFGQTTGSANVGTAEQSRILIEFDVNEMLSDISSGVVPSSSVDYFLKLYNAPHGGTTPLSYSLDVAMVSGAWSEGRGLDMENYSDFGYSNWIQPNSTVNWVVTGSDYYGGSAFISSYFFSGGIEDLELNVNYAFDEWRSLNKENAGFLIKHTDPVISGTLGTFYTKKFFGRTSEFMLKRPYIEARWNSSRQDQRGSFIVSSSLASAANNLNTLYLYNSVRGQLQDIPYLNGERITVSLYADFSGSTSGSNLEVKGADNATVTAITGGILIENGIQRTGIYTASFATTSSYSTLHDVWFTSSDGGVTQTQYYTGSFNPGTLQGNALIYDEEYISAITNLRPSYFVGEKPTLRVFPRKKNWSPNIYTVANSSVVPDVIEDSYYRLYRTVDNFEILPYSTGSNQYTKLSYDVSGNYFSLDTSYLEPGYTYAVQLLYYINGIYKEQPEIFKFRIDEEQQ
jgi:hypothetical protein